MLFVVTAATSLVYLLLVLLVDTVPVNAYMIWCNVMEADQEKKKKKVTSLTK
jgi:hypothetical protein